MPRRAGPPHALVAAILSLAASSCGGALPIVDETPHERMPLWAGIEIVGDPPVAEQPLRLEILTLPEEEHLRAATFPSGTVIRWSEVLSANAYRVLADDGRCSIDIELPPERSTTYAIERSGSGCAFVLAPDQSLPESTGHLSATVTVQPWEGLLVEAISLDDPAQPVPEPVPPDEGGLAQLFPLYAGRYEIRLRRGDDILETQSITVIERGPAGDLIELELDGVPD